MKWLAACALILGSTMAYADGNKLSVPANPKWKEECGSCHIAYPPQLLAADNWQRLMGGLDKHFGANAVLNPGDNQEILDFLQRHAGRGGRNSASSLRISDTPWFTREHREVSNNTWSDPAVKSRSNCTACHVNAERGDWSERGVRIPGGRRGEGHEGHREHGGERDDD
ncbi:MAG: diheme cytochrome c [Betaproteobacteria bacterium]|nr:diheme cytochrome c [Betaproteobacteria bacterium]